MENIRFDRVLSVNSETTNHEASCLLHPGIGATKSWLCAKGSEKAITILKMERAAVVTKIDVGNAHSAFIEVLVGRAADASDKFQTLIPTSSFMSPNESKSSQNQNQVRFFAIADFDPAAVGKQWDLLKVVCSQPFNKHVPYGICFIKVHGEKIEPVIPLRKAEEPNIAVGSFFRKRKDSPSETVKTIADKIREAQRPDALAKHTPLRTKTLSVKLGTSPSSSSRNADDSPGQDNRKNSFLGLDDEPNLIKKTDISTTEDKSTEKAKQSNKKLEERSDERSKSPYEVSKKRRGLDYEDDNDNKSPKPTTSSKGRERDKDSSKIMARDEEIDRRRQTMEKAQLKEKEKPQDESRKGKEEKDRSEPKRPGDDKLSRDKSRHEKRKKKGKPFNRLMEDVVLVLSGFQNPHRGTYRAHALEMGARYNADWEDGRCTHLVASYINTPKCNQVKGKGKIVSKDWIEKCYVDKKRYPWRRFALDKKEKGQPESEEEIDVEREATPSPPPPSKRFVPVASTSRVPTPPKAVQITRDPSGNKYDVSTDEDEDDHEFLPCFFTGKIFYVDDNISEKSVLERYIIAYDGSVIDKLNNDVHYFITSLRGPALDIMRQTAKNYEAVSPTWIQAINCQKKFLPSSSFRLQ